MKGIFSRLNINKYFFYFPILIIYFEIIIKITSFNKLFDIGLLIMIFHSITIGLILSILTSLSTDSLNKKLAVAFTLLLTIYYGFQFLYYKIFYTFFSLYSIIGARDAFQFWKECIFVIINNIVPILFILIPLFLIILLINKNKLIINKADKNSNIKVSSFAAISQIVALIIIFNSNTGDLNSHYLYSKSFIIDVSVNRFGLLTTQRLDMKNLFKSFNTFKAYEVEKDDKTNMEFDSNSNVYALEHTTTETAIKNIPQYNVLNIDFDYLIENEQDNTIKDMHKYFKSLTPSIKNDYTGIFKGKNLILITAEGFSPYAINKDLTPTLYRMYHEGYQFTDFYTPIWGVSTSDGEYVACTGLLPKAGVWSFYESSKNYMPFCMGNQMKKLGYSTYAYHNHYFDYYRRDKSHPNMGYAYKGLGNGLNVTETWPESDLEMIDLTIEEYINNEPFHVYYMTVSGHLQYSFNGNYIANKNRAAVDNLPYSEAVKAYLACNIELDKAMELLIKRLEEGGIAENTVIAISPDHYPYGLDISEINELAGHEVENYRGC
jgi:lipoteichoic acid synthase